MYPVPAAIAQAVTTIDPDAQFLGYVTFCFEVGEDLDGMSPETVLSEFREQYDLTGDQSYKKLANAVNGLELVTLAASVAGWHLSSEGTFNRA